MVRSVHSGRGGPIPPEEEDPTIQQLSLLQKRLETQNIAPFVDLAVFVPYGQRALKASKGYVTKELPGLSCFSQWHTCYRLLKTALIMLDSVSLASLWAYESTIERLSRTYPSCWHLIYSTDEVAGSAQSNRVRSRIIMDIRAGRQGPEGFSQNRQWD